MVILQFWTILWWFFFSRKLVSMGFHSFSFFLLLHFHFWSTNDANETVQRCLSDQQINGMCRIYCLNGGFWYCIRLWIKMVNCICFCNKFESFHSCTNECVSVCTCLSLCFVCFCVQSFLNRLKFSVCLFCFRYLTKFYGKCSKLMWPSCVCVCDGCANGFVCVCVCV